MSSKEFLTYEGLRKLEDELEYLRTTKRNCRYQAGINVWGYRGNSESKEAKRTGSE